MPTNNFIKHLSHMIKVDESVVAYEVMIFEKKSNRPICMIFMSVYFLLS